MSDFIVYISYFINELNNNNSYSKLHANIAMAMMVKRDCLLSAIWERKWSFCVFFALLCGGCCWSFFLSGSPGKIENIFLYIKRGKVCVWDRESEWKKKQHAWRCRWWKSDTSENCSFYTSTTITIILYIFVFISVI